MQVELKEMKSYASYIQVQNVKVFYEMYNHPSPKATLVFIHGFLSSSFSFRHIIPILNQNFTTVTIDLPGFGNSEKSLKFYYSYHNYGKLILDIINKLGLMKVMIIGHSMGGQIALHVAKQAPQLIDKLFLISSSGYLRRARIAARYFSYFPYFSWFVQQWSRRYDAKQKISESLFDKTLIDEQMIEGYITPFSDKHFFDSLIRLLRHREGDLSSEELKTITTPAILIWGKEDESVPLHIGERLKADLQNSEMITIPDTGHMICDEKPHELSMEIFNHI